MTVRIPGERRLPVPKRRASDPPHVVALHDVLDELDAGAIVGMLTEKEWNACFSRALAALYDVGDDRERMRWLDPVLDHGVAFGLLRD